MSSMMDDRDWAELGDFLKVILILGIVVAVIVLWP